MSREVAGMITAGDDVQEIDGDWVRLSDYERLEKETDRLRRVLEKLARLGSEPEYGNSIGNEIARRALEQSDK